MEKLTTRLKMKQCELAIKLQTHPVYLNAILRGRATPSPKMALRIEEATGGDITRMELLYPLPKAPNAQ
jgi:DNA-binding transcriptional regulator YdaS (Cro superfamily)